MFANWPMSGCCSESCAGVLLRVFGIMFAIGRCQSAVQGAIQGVPDHNCHGAVQGAPHYVCHWAVSACCVVQGVLCRVLRIMFAVGPLCFCSGVLLRGAVQGAPDHVCHGAVQRYYPGCSRSRLLLGCVRVLSRAPRIMFAIMWYPNCLGCSPKCSPGCSGSCLPLGRVRVLFAWICRLMSTPG